MKYKTPPPRANNRNINFWTRGTHVWKWVWLQYPKSLSVPRIIQNSEGSVNYTLCYHTETILWLDYWQHHNLRRPQILWSYNKSFNWKISKILVKLTSNLKIKERVRIINIYVPLHLHTSYQAELRSLPGTMW
jgi:hypothetical protein